MNINAERTVECLLNNDNILILSHKSPDGDTLGSAFALYYALISIGKKVRIKCSDPMPERFSFMTSEYEESDFEPDYIVAVDIAAIQLFGEEIECYADKVDLSIDHHPSNELFAKETYLVSTAGANCENVFEIIKLLNVPITVLIANCIYTGVSTDTGCFKFSNTTSKTHIIAAELFDFGAEYEFINRLMFETKSKNRIKIEQYALGAIEYYYDDKVAVIAITQQMINETKFDESEFDGLSSIPRTIDGVQVGVTMRERKEGGFKFSIRTASKVNASELCAKFGGGGHKRAAGCLIEENYETAKKMMIDEIGVLLKKG